MSKLFTIYSDLHEGSKYLALPIAVPRDLEVIKTRNIYLIGDIKERKNCEPSALGMVDADYHALHNIYGARYIDGNHEVMGSGGARHLIIDAHICLAHGDWQLWDLDKVIDFRNEKAGQGSGFIQKIIAGKNGSISNSEAKQLADYARRINCNVIVIGHVHPKRVFDEMVNGVRVICVPRGKTELYI